MDQASRLLQASRNRTHHLGLAEEDVLPDERAQPPSIKQKVRGERKGRHERTYDKEGLSQVNVEGELARHGVAMWVRGGLFKLVTKPTTHALLTLIIILPQI